MRQVNGSEINYNIAVYIHKLISIKITLCAFVCSIIGLFNITTDCEFYLQHEPCMSNNNNCGFVGVVSNSRDHLLFST